MDNSEIQVIESLSGNDPRLLKYIPYILQDLFALGSDQQVLLQIIKRNINLFKSETKVLELCCGKGASILSLIKEFGWYGKGIDLFESFILDARKNADELNVSDKVSFDVQDIKAAIVELTGYDLVLFGSDTNCLGTEAESIIKAGECLNENGYIIYETAFPFFQPLEKNLESAGINIIDKITHDPKRIKEQNSYNTKMIKKRVEELLKPNPESYQLLNEYVANQEIECADLEEHFTQTTYLCQISCPNVKYIK